MEPNSTEQYDAALSLFILLQRLSLNKVSAAEADYLDFYNAEFGWCSDCGDSNMDCQCNKYNEDCDDYGGCKCNNEDGSCYC